MPLQLLRRIGRIEHVHAGADPPENEAVLKLDAQRRRRRALELEFGDDDPGRSGRGAGGRRREGYEAQRSDGEYTHRRHCNR